MSKIVLGNPFPLPSVNEVKVTRYEPQYGNRRAGFEVSVMAGGKILAVETLYVHKTDNPELNENEDPTGRTLDLIDKLDQDPDAKSLSGVVTVKRGIVSPDAFKDLKAAMAAAGDEEDKNHQYIIDKKMVPAGLNPSVE